MTKKASARATILVVDDNEGDFHLLCEASREIQFDAHYERISHPDKLFPRLEGAHVDATISRPNLIILDINLPKTTGHKVLEMIKADTRFSSIPVVMYSSVIPHQCPTEASEIGPIGYMVKPSTFEEYLPLLKTLRDLIEYTASQGEGTLSG